MKTPMKLDGGIKMYCYGGDKIFDRYNNKNPPKGRKVIFLNDNGYDYEREYANTLFPKGQILTVNEIYVGRSNSEVEFEEFPGEKFNTVMFADMKES